VGLALVCVAAAAVCSGSAVVLQAVAVRHLPPDVTLGVHLVRRLASAPLYLLAMGLVAAGFLLAAVAMRTLPLFVVQAGRASSLGVAALLSVWALGARLRLVEWLGLAATAVGLVVLALSVEPSSAVDVTDAPRSAVALSTLLLVAVGVPLGLVRGTTRRGLALAVVAGWAFAVLALAARTVPDTSVGGLVTDPMVWCAGVAGGLGLAMTALALRRAPVVAVTAITVGVETVASAVLGVVLAGDRPADGAWSVAAVGFVLVLTGALVVARFGSPDDARTPSPDAAQALPLP